MHVLLCPGEAAKPSLYLRHVWNFPSSPPPDIVLHSLFNIYLSYLCRNDLTFDDLKLCYSKSLWLYDVHLPEMYYLV